MQSSHSTYVIFFTDSLGNRTTTPDIWDRSLNGALNGNGRNEFLFEWNWYRHDSLVMVAKAKVDGQSWLPLEYSIFRNDSLQRTIHYQPDQARVRTVRAKTQTDSTYSVPLSFPAFVFPMDLEVFGALPFKKQGQRFVIPFYEPGSRRQGYYTYSLESQEGLEVALGVFVNCWVLKSEYDDPGNYQRFWIAKKSREVLKVEQRFNGRYRYKVKLFVPKMSHAAIS